MACKKEFRNISSISDRAQCRKKKTTKKCVTGSKFHCKLEWIFVEEDRREGVVQFVLGIVFLD